MVFLVLLLLSQSPASCSTVDDCRQKALSSEAAGDFETFHDLAWRAVQKGKPNDPDLMLLLARAMSLSGRPGDAIVMLARLADMGVKSDAATSDAFRRVRALKDWPALEARLAGLPGPSAAPEAEPPSRAGAPPSAAAPETARAAPPRAPDAPVTPGAPLAPRAHVADALSELSFAPAPRSVSGLAYDAVSRRFLIGDPAGARLLVVDEPTHHMATLVGATAAGFYDTLTAFEVDHRRGDLWVVSTKAEGGRPSSVLHKIQLVSGRVLTEVLAEDDVRLVDVTVTADGTVYALDAQGSRILRLRPGAHALEDAIKLHLDAPVSLAMADDRIGYVASPDGLSRVDLASQATVRVSGGDATAGIEVLRSSGPSLIAVERTDQGARLVRLEIDRGGRAVKSVHVLDDRLPAATAASISNGTLFYISSPGTIRAIRLR
jgi:hypothetical protein